MTDIVERLREDARGGMAYHELSDEAADEIERLREIIRQRTFLLDQAHDEIERLRAVLQEIADMRYANTSAAMIAHTALGQRTTDELGTRNVDKSNKSGGASD